MPKVLYVDKCDSVSNVRKDMIVHEGFNVRYENTYDDAIEVLRLKEFVPDIILLGEKLEGTDILDVVRGIKTDKLLCRKTPIIMLSNSCDADRHMEIVVSGIVDIIRRDANINFLIAKIRALFMIKCAVSL
jgi:DNA-binding response OmpR family regulator